MSSKNAFRCWSKNISIMQNENFIASLQERCTVPIRQHAFYWNKNGAKFCLRESHWGETVKEKNQCKAVGKTVLKERPWICKQDACCLDPPPFKFSTIWVHKNNSIHRWWPLFSRILHLDSSKGQFLCQWPSVVMLVQNVFSLGLWHGLKHRLYCIYLFILFFSNQFHSQVFHCLDLSRFSMSRADCNHVDIDYSIRPEKALSREKTN